MIYIIGGEKCIELSMESDHCKSFFYKGRYFVRLSDYKDGYKITLRSLDPAFTYDHYYQCDFMSMVEDGFIIIKTSDNQTIKHISWLEPLCNNVCIRHDADIIDTITD